MERVSINIVICKQMVRLRGLQISGQTIPNHIFDRSYCLLYICKTTPTSAFLSPSPENTQRSLTMTILNFAGTTNGIAQHPAELDVSIANCQVRS